MSALDTPATVIPAKERHPVPRYGAGIHPSPLRALCGESNVSVEACPVLIRGGGVSVGVR